MNKSIKYMVVTVVAAMAISSASIATAGWGNNRGYCDRANQGGPQMMNKKGRSGGPVQRNLDLTADEAKTLVQARLIMRGNDRLKAGEVSEKDQGTYLVDIVTVDNSLVRQIEVDKDNGLPRGRKGHR